jgi:hypothetical protein
VVKEIGLLNKGKEGDASYLSFKVYDNLEGLNVGSANRNDRPC